MSPDVGLEGSVCGNTSELHDTACSKKNAALDAQGERVPRSSSIIKRGGVQLLVAENDELIADVAEVPAVGHNNAADAAVTGNDLREPEMQIWQEIAPKTVCIRRRIELLMYIYPGYFDQTELQLE